jgi:ribonuclease-3
VAAERPIAVSVSEAVTASLNHRFRDPTLLAQALTHRSHGARHNERLEFVGDAVLNCVIGIELFQRFPELPEGDLSRARAALVNRDTLARLAQGLELGASIRLGDGERKSGGVARPSILADTLEAIFGAVYVDAGFEAARTAILSVYAEVWTATAATVLSKDPKTRLQEWLQAQRLPVPDYAVAAIRGEAHAQLFVVECRIPSQGIIASGEGSSRRVAEQAAASAALHRIEETTAAAGGATMRRNAP